ncbi:dihydropteroate synthase [Pontiella agarivorans]|uniref:Dihydropteroate synthase n=1 Tax=Pontiella agarivorans TaxID=3038953 RepID=A0ABU5MWI9_9BACT|nr:dihydropteroate synthase [Pontiella agarivorans]MDZ8118585.1 dihydropteroate synthase [Pontiella agarivorans]
MARKKYDWHCGNRTVHLGEKTRVMGILNVTPDSFSDGGHFADPEIAVQHALQMVEDGAAIIDIGGESTRPGAEPVSVKEEIRRTVPIIEKIREHTEVLISIDTMKSETAFHALEAGADIINDVSGFEADDQMVNVAAASEAGVILMHMKGTPQTMQQNPSYEDAVTEVFQYLEKRITFAVSRGVVRERIVVDPGIGFGKTLEHNLQLLRGIPDLEKTAPVLIGASRKSMIGKLLEREDPSSRLAGSLGIAGWSAVSGAHILRVHDVLDTCDVCRIVDTLCTGDL